MQNRVSNLHQILREMIDRAEASRLSRGIGAAALTAVLLSFVTIGAGWAAAEKSKRLSGSQIRAKFIGMQLTDEVHWRDVYERDGTLRSYSMGRKQIGKWRVEKDELCLDLPEPDGGCFEVASTATGFTLTPKGAGLALEGVLQPPSDRK